MTTIDSLALALGYAMIVVAGLFSALLLLLLALNALWIKIQDGRDLYWISEAVQHYEKIKPRPAKD